MKKQFRFYLFSLVCMLFCCLDQPASALVELPTVCDSNNIIPDIGSDVFSDARQGGCAPTFTWLETNPCEVQFTGPSCDPCALTGGAMNVTWNFGDGSPMYTGVDPFHVFPPGGVWYVCMTIQCVDADGNVASTSDICQFIYTTCCSEPSFSWTEINPCEVQFFGPDCNPCGLYNTEVVWDFGDGSGTVTGADPFHVFAGPGPFNVCMTVNCVYDDGSVTVYTWTTCQVVATSCCNNPNFSWVETNPCEVYFIGPDCDPCAPLGVMDIYWDFGDGSPVAFGANPTHVYGPGGPWNVCMTVMCINFDGTSGATYTQCNTVTTNCCPQPDFTWTETSPCLVQFTGPSCDPCVGTGMVTNVFWNFGDGNTGVGPNPVNDYSASGPGSDNVCMTVECLDPAIGIPTFTYTTCEVITVV
ncbi:MAG: hypothetical protein JNM00_01625, partial [Flavobacteriales bacterium]|nr:hypothetical protein [Flavobacteriales bacterium]